MLQEQARQRFRLLLGQVELGLASAWVDLELSSLHPDHIDALGERLHLGAAGTLIIVIGCAC